MYCVLALAVSTNKRQPAYLRHPCMPVIPLVPSDSPTLISSLLRLSAHHLALAALASQPLKSGTLSLYLSVPVPVLTPSVVISRPTTASRPSNPLNPSPLAPQIRLCLAVFKLFLTTDPYSPQAQLADPHTCYSKIYCKILKFLSTLLFTNKPTSSIIYKINYNGLNGRQTMLV